MKDCIREIAIFIVFRYLSDIELTKVANVCSTWKTFARNEEKLRGPMCVRRKMNEMINDINWFDLKIDIMNCFGPRPGLQIFFCNYVAEIICNSDTDESLIDKCYCKQLPTNAHSIVLEKNLKSFNNQNEDTIVSFIIPRTEKTEMATFTFIEDNVNRGLFCPEINFICNNEFDMLQFMKNNMQTYFINNISSCLFVFTSYPCHTKILDFIELLRQCCGKRINYTSMAITDSVKVCKNSLNQYLCNTHPLFSLSYIRNPSLFVRIRHLKRFCDTKEKIQEQFEELKKTIKLKKYSIALMCTPYWRVDAFYSLEDSLFREIFPKVNLFHFSGCSSFSGLTIDKLYEYFRREHARWGKTTSITLITYD